MVAQQKGNFEYREFLTQKLLFCGERIVDKQDVELYNAEQDGHNNERQREVRHSKLSQKHRHSIISKAKYERIQTLKYRNTLLELLSYSWKEVPGKEEMTVEGGQSDQQEHSKGKEKGPHGESPAQISTSQDGSRSHEEEYTPEGLMVGVV
ncbi:UNVERIFIED_CONTAM: hypothetical protein K2H54_035659 [Gekko kuhli]